MVNIDKMVDKSTIIEALFPSPLNLTANKVVAAADGIDKVKNNTFLMFTSIGKKITHKMVIKDITISLLKLAKYASLLVNRSLTFICESFIPITIMDIGVTR